MGTNFIIEEDTVGDERIDADNNQLSFNKTSRVRIQVRNLSIGSRISSKRKFINVRLGKSKPVDIEASESIKPILHPLSFDIEPASFTCIIGGSGSGKTTLLNCLADRQFSKSTLVRQGTIKYNNSDNLDGIRHAYVIQQDILIPELTCYETLMYAAEMKLPKLTSKSQRAQLVSEIILVLGLKECTDTIVGDRRRKGMSGGEKRRLSVALQLISNPSVLFLDEPTTGLDSYNAYLLCLTLKRLTQRLNKTIVMSVHQPRADIFKLFDNVLILSNGNLCYGSSYDNVYDYCKEIGYPIPEQKVNPADFVIDMTSIDTRTFDQEKESSKRVDRIVSLWKETMNSMGEIETVPEDEEENSVFEQVGRAPFFREVTILVRRSLLLQRRDPLGILAVLLEALVLGLITGWLFFKPGTSVAGMRSLEASLYMSGTLMCYLFTLYEAYRLCQQDLRVFDRERMEKCVSIPGFIISRRIAKLLTEDLAIPILFSLPAYFMIGLRTESSKYFWKYFAGLFVANINTMAIGMFAACCSRDVSIATLICNLNFTFQTMTNGMFVNVKHMPVYVKWCRYVSYQWYSFGYLISNQFTDFYGSCFTEYADDPDVESLCYTSDGNYAISQLGFYRHWDALPICVVVALCLATFIEAGLVLKLAPVDISMGKDVKSLDTVDNRINYSDSNKDGETSLKEDPGVHVAIRGISLQVKKKLDKEAKDILHSVSANFQARRLNAIMGPSGSGKTSLLNLIGGRLSSRIDVKYTSSGEIYLNNYVVEDFGVVKPLCCYVMQDDDHLLASMTVKETLRFAATLRLSKAKLSKEKRNEIVNDVILKMGLRDCANTLVGNDLIKGISGGEKRRLSIAIQILSSPRILFLDEPTSGLDAFTASSILECLENLTRHGTTVIMTIHQPRTLDMFGNILLLTKGGYVAFDGTQDELLDHFASLGFPAPKFTNVGDFVIDLISYNTANAEIEERTRARVNLITENWIHEYDDPAEPILVTRKDELRDCFDSYVKEPADFVTGFQVLARRQWISLMRDKNLLISRSTQIIGMGIILAFFFSRLKFDQNGVQDRFGLIQNLTSLYFTGMLNNIAGYPPERDYFYDEFNDDVVSIASFFFSYLTVEIPFEIFPTIIFAVLLMFVVGLQYRADLFFCIFYTTVLVINAGESLGISFNTILDHPGFALTIISVFCSIAVCMSGLMAMTLDSFLKAMNYLSPPHYAVMLASNYIFEDDLHLTCDSSQVQSDGSCQFTRGSQVLDSYNLGVNLKLYWIMITVMAIIHRVVSYLFLRLKLTKIKIARHK